MVRDTLRFGSLVRLFDAVTMPITIYSVAYTASRRSDTRIQLFRDWIFQEASTERVLPASDLAMA